MRIPSDAERARICETLVGVVGLSGLWSWLPLEEAVAPCFTRQGDDSEPLRHWSLYEGPWTGDGPWTDAQKRVVAVAWSVWNHNPGAGLGDLLGDQEQVRRAVADLLLLPTSADWLDAWRPGWRKERIEHYTLSKWETPEWKDDEPYWSAHGTYATEAAARSALSCIEGRARIQLFTGFVEGPKARELIYERQG